MHPDQKKSINLEEKLKILKYALEHSYKSAAEKYNVSEINIRKWKRMHIAKLKEFDSDYHKFPAQSPFNPSKIPPIYIDNGLVTLDLSKIRLNTLNDIPINPEYVNVEKLILIDNDLHSLEGISQFPRLFELDLSWNYLGNYDDLIKLPQLKRLHLNRTMLKDLRILAPLTQLEVLVLDNNRIEDLRGLDYLKDLKKLSIRSNFIEDLSYIENLQSLQYLDLSWNKIENLSFLESLFDLRFLDLHKNKIQNLDPLRDLQNLIYLDVSRNFVHDVSPLVNLLNLLTLNISKNRIVSQRALKWLHKRPCLQIETSENIFFTHTLGKVDTDISITRKNA